MYDINRLDNAVRLRVSRRLRRLGASKLQHSVWEFSGLAELRGIATLIKSAGGKALILEKRVVRG